MVIEVGEFSFVEFTVTTVPETNTCGVPEKPLPVRVTLRDFPRGTVFGLTLVIFGPGVVTP
jgi:hypothetical protein